MLCFGNDPECLQYCKDFLYTFFSAHRLHRPSFKCGRPGEDRGGAEVVAASVLRCNTAIVLPETTAITPFPSVLIIAYF